MRFASSQRVLVTGAGGYIGSALVRAIAATGPQCLIALDSSEQNLFELQQRLDADSLVHEAVLGSVCDEGLLDDLFSRFQPDIVYHAAAFKHVPLLEAHPFAATCNNALGTHTLAQAARRHDAGKLVLVSTDKAVNPRSVMGITKRIAELAIVSLSSPACCMNAVRLGNVTGSTGSVVPLFQRQIAEGVQVTVTHPEVSRYFMSCDDAVAAILACGQAECDGKILLPQLGSPVLIADLARSLMPSDQIPIRFTSLRPGDKLTEELISANETCHGTAGPLTILRTPKLAPAELCELMQQLSACIATRDLPGLMQALTRAVPEYVPSR